MQIYYIARNTKNEKSNLNPVKKISCWIEKFYI